MPAIRPDESAENIIAELDDYSKESLKRKEDLERIIELGIKHNKIAVLEDTAFTGKYLYGLFSIIRRGENAVDEAVLQKYMQEFTENVEKLKAGLKELIEPASSFFKNIFHDKYFSLTQESMINLNDLCSDLNYLKMYLNDRKYGK